MTDERGRGETEPEPHASAGDGSGLDGTDWLLGQFSGADAPAEEHSGSEDRSEREVEPHSGTASDADDGSRSATASDADDESRSQTASDVDDGPRSASVSGAHAAADDRVAIDDEDATVGEDVVGPRVFRSTFTPTESIALPTAAPPDADEVADAEPAAPAPKMRWSWTTGRVELIEPGAAGETTESASAEETPVGAPLTTTEDPPEGLPLTAAGASALAASALASRVPDEVASPVSARGTSEGTDDVPDAGLTEPDAAANYTPQHAALQADTATSNNDVPVPQPENPEGTASYQPQSRAERRRSEAAAGARAPIIADSVTSDAAGSTVRHSSASDVPVAETSAVGGARGATPTGVGAGRRSTPTTREKRRTRILFVVGGALLLLLILIGLYIFGRQLPGMIGAASTVTATPTPTSVATKTPTATPTPSAAVASGPLASGTHSWETLRGGECLQPFATPWADTFTVVDCATPHAAQMVYTNVFSSDPKAAYPGADQLASQINVLCTKPGILNLDVAGQLSDAQVQGTYPATPKQWKDGQRSYFCFVNRSSGQAITGSVAGSGPTS